MVEGKLNLEIICNSCQKSIQDERNFPEYENFDDIWVEDFAEEENWKVNGDEAFCPDCQKKEAN